MDSENIEIYSPIYHALISKEDFLARISFQSELNIVFNYELQAVKKGNYTIMFLTDVSAQSSLDKVYKQNENLKKQIEVLKAENEDLQKIKQKAQYEEVYYGFKGGKDNK